MVFVNTLYTKKIQFYNNGRSEFCWKVAINSAVLLLKI